MRPIVILPGIGGSILIKRGQEYKTLFGQKILDNRWMNITPFAKDSLTRWRHDMRMDIVRDHVSQRVVGFKNYDPDIYPYDFKGIGGITDIVPEFGLLAEAYSEILHRHFHFRYFGRLCDHLKAAGYVPRESLFGLPYDSRRLLDSAYRTGYFKSIRETIEEAVRKNNANEESGTTSGTRLPTIVAHSMGGVLLKWFLSSAVVSPDWIQEHIGRLVVVNAPFGGTTMALRAIMSGEYYVPMFHQEFRASLQKMAGILMCLPNEYAFAPNEPLVCIDEPPRLIRLQDYAGDAPMLAPNDSMKDSFDIWRDLYVPHLPTIMTPLNLQEIPCTLVLGTDQTTAHKINIKREGELPYSTKTEMGDGQVPNRSLYLAKTVFQGSRVETLEIPGSGHIDVLSHPRFIESVLHEV
jgi:hypothetical protein